MADFQLSVLPQMPNVAKDQTEAVQAANAVGQRSALQGVDVNKPDSMDSAISGLVRNAGIEQANALQNLSFSRFQKDLVQKAVGDALGKQGGQQSQASDFDKLQKADKLYQSGANELSDLMRKPEGERQAAAQGIAARLINQGVPPEVAKQYLGDLSDNHLGQSIATLADLHHDALSHMHGVNSDTRGMSADQFLGKQAADMQQRQFNAQNEEWARGFLTPETYAKAAVLEKFGLPFLSAQIKRAEEILKPQMAAHEAGLTANAKAPYELETVNMPDGSTIQVPKSLALSLTSQNALGGGRGAGRSQSTEEKEAAGIRAKNANEVGLQEIGAGQSIYGTKNEAKGAAGGQIHNEAERDESKSLVKLLEPDTTVIKQSQDIKSQADNALRALNEIQTNKLGDARSFISKWQSTLGFGKDADKYAGNTEQLANYLNRAVMQGARQDVGGRVAVAEAQIEKNAAPTLKSQKDTIAYYITMRKAQAERDLAFEEYKNEWRANHAGNYNRAQFMNDWKKTPYGKWGAYASPAFRDLQLNGKPALPQLVKPNQGAR